MKNLRFLIICTLIIIFSNDLFAQEWRQTNGPSSGSIKAIAFNKANEMFVLSNVLLRSTNNGQSWTQLANFLPNGTIAHVAIAPTNDIYISTIESYYLGNNKSGLWKSTDNGSSWTLVYNSDRIASIITSPDSSVHISIWRYGNESYSYRSVDYGATWDSSYVSSSLAIMAAGANSSGYLFYCGSGFAYRSTNKGKSWSKLINGINNGDFRSICFAPTGSIFITSGGSGYDNGIFKSIDSGRTWKKVDYSIMYGAAVAPNGKIFGVSTDGYIYSDDDGETWRRYKSLTIERAWQVDPGTPIVADDDTNFYVVAQGQIFRSHCYQDTILKSWELVNAPMATVKALIAHPNGTLIAASNAIEYGNNGRIWRSTNEGVTWTTLPDSDRHAINTPTCFAIDSNKNIVLGDGGSILHSTDIGATWKAGNVRLTNGLLTSIVVAPNGLIYASSDKEGIYRSTDNGVTWDQLNDGIINLNILTLAVGFGNEVYAGGVNGAYSSTDNGITWQALYIDSNIQTVQSMVVSLQGNIIVGTNSLGMYQSTDDGNSWVHLNNGLPATTINTLLVTPSGIIFCSTNDGVFQLAVNDTIWTSYDKGLTTKKVLSLARNSQGQLFCGTDGCGIFSSLQTFNIIQQHASNSNLPDIYDIKTYPNPAADYCNVSIKLKHSTSLSIKCLDSRGIAVGNVIQDYYTAGIHTISLNTHDLPSGYYGLSVSNNDGMRIIPFVITK